MLQALDILLDFVQLLGVSGNFFAKIMCAETYDVVRGADGPHVAVSFQLKFYSEPSLSPPSTANLSIYYTRNDDNFLNVLGQ